MKLREGSKNGREEKDALGYARIIHINMTFRMFIDIVITGGKRKGLLMGALNLYDIGKT